MDTIMSMTLSLNRSVAQSLSRSVSTTSLTGLSKRMGKKKSGESLRPLVMLK